MLDDIRANASAEYLAYSANHPDEQSVGDYILLYGQSYIAERNETYELATYLPGWFTLGDDGGGTAILMRLDGSPAVYRCEHGAIGSHDPESIAASFTKWLAADCPLPSEPKQELPMYGDLWLVHAPNGGLKDMLRLKNALQLTSSLGALKEILSSTPALIERDLPCGKYMQRAKSIPELAACIAFSECGEDDPIIPISL